MNQSLNLRDKKNTLLIKAHAKGPIQGKVSKRHPFLPINIILIKREGAVFRNIRCAITPNNP